MHKVVFAIVAGILISSQALAADDFYERSYLAPNIYYDGGYGTTYFGRPSTIPLNGTAITNVEWDWGLYTNGATSQVMELCYQPQYTTIEDPCINITEAQTGATDAFDGLSARGSFTLRHTLYGGTYPVYPSHYDTIRVEYSY